MNVAILGTGNIARDLYRKIERSKNLELILVAGRNLESAGSVEAKKFSRLVADRGIESILEHASKFELLFDASSAAAHLQVIPILDQFGIKAIDLTPSGNGSIVIPTVNISDAKNINDISLVSCGGQSSIPLIYAVIEEAKKKSLKIDYVELTSVIASISAGPATRANLDNYIAHTEEAISKFSGCPSKVILNVNPAAPPITMQNSISFRFKDPASTDKDFSIICDEMAQNIQKYVPGYKITFRPKFIDEVRLFISLSVTGVGDYLPSYAGNLDIITSAAVRVAEYISNESSDL